ncbi:MAG: TolB family protein, partial [Planctomycetota bacterium]
VYGSATLFADEGKVDRIGAKWGYTAWHPTGRVAVYSVMNVKQFMHRASMEVRDVVDLDAGLKCYDLKKQSVNMPRSISDSQRLESYPTWSPDGKYLYYCSAPILWQDRNSVPPRHYDKVRYDLMRVSYDVESDKWGKPELFLSGEKLGKSILMPRISPDGRFLLFCMCDYGVFPIYRPCSDLYLMKDIETREYEKLPINSKFSESWHSWSSNGRWIAFSSKRRGGLFTRLYISYVDSTGKAHKPFILPQRNPEFYDSFLKTYSVPELVTGPVEVSHRALTSAARSANTITPATAAVTTATPKASEAKVSEPYRQSPR